MSAPLAALIWIGLRLTLPRILSAAARYAIWWAALAVAVALPAVYLPAHPSASVVRIADPPEVPPEIASPPAAVIHAIPIPTAKPPRFPLQIPAGPWIKWISAAWALAATLFLLRLAVSFALLSGRKARARIISESVPASTRRTVRMAVSDEVSAPMAAGFLRPTILIPARLFGQLDGSELDFIGLHEAAHFARRDDYALIVERLVEALFALHPIVHWIARRIDLEREIACDDRVVEATGRPLPYAACLTRVAELTGGVCASFAAAAATREGSHLTRRVEMLLDKTRDTGTRWGTRWLKTRLACALAVVSALAWTAARTPALLAVTTPSQTAPPAPAVAAAETPLPKTPPRLIAQAAPPKPPAPERPADAAAPSRVVLVPVEVADYQDRVVAGLNQQNFRILEDDVEQQISYFSAIDEPASLGVVSQNPDGLTLPLQEELVRLQQTVPVRVEFIETADANLSIGDAARPAMNRIRQEGHTMHRVVLVLDGHGAAPLLSYTEGGVTVISAPGTNDAVQTIASFLQGNSYILGYTPLNRSTDGKYRHIRVTLSRVQGLPPLTIHYRSGYYASENPAICNGRVLSFAPLPPNATCY